MYLSDHVSFKGFILPRENAREVAVVDSLTVYGVENLREVIDFFNGDKELEQTIVNTREEFFSKANECDQCFQLSKPKAG